MNGDVYVKLSDLKGLLSASSGSYDSGSGTYTFETSDPIVEIAKKTSPSVVAIIGKSQLKSGESSSKNDRFNLIHGTGVVWESNGWIVTNAHVVKDMAQITVVTYDGHQYAGKKMYVDEESDLALVKIDATDLVKATFAEKLDVEVGDPVIAIGTPISFTLRNTVTSGIISGLGRSVNSTYRLLQTDAAINPGNSGGALVNAKGEVIGINSLKYAAAGIDNIGFAIPSETVIYVINNFMQYGKVNRSTLGMNLEESWAAVVGLPTEDPLKVITVNKNSGAEKTGVVSGDLLYSIDGVSINTIVDVNELLKKYTPGQTVTLKMLSGGDLVERELVLSESK
ncbi:trypsin-like serine protease [Paenibacillus cremeus]|uniref:Trypsin-like serine protease n=1 Tax=Paenibacillus cremeus TaxID=2163881 RepID=A0A559K0Q0_9BACL|nr:trypsin-like serine protease [Paenibacillus cremeus]